MEALPDVYTGGAAKFQRKGGDLPWIVHCPKTAFCVGSI